MILHAASIAAFFVAQTQQAQCVVQCVQAAPGTWLDRLLHFLPQFIVSIIPVAGGVWIAFWSFKVNSQKDHKQWLQDEKKTEWKQIIEALNVCRPFLQEVYHQQVSRNGTVNRYGFDPVEEVRKLDQLFISRIFIDHDIKDYKVDVAWEAVKTVAASSKPLGNFGLAADYDDREYSGIFDTLIRTILFAVEFSLVEDSGGHRSKIGLVKGRISGFIIRWLHPSKR